MRQRVRTRGSALRVLGRALVALLACALVFYGAMLVLLALKVSASTVNSISAYRTIFDFLAGLAPGGVNRVVTRAIVAGAGLVALLVFGTLALRELPRPYLARRDLPLVDDDHGVVIVAPRAVERVAESAAATRAAVTGAAGRFEADELVVAVSARDAAALPATLRGVQADVRAALERHGLPAMPVAVTLASFDAKQPREPA